MNFIAILLGGMLINNFVLARFLGLCPFMGVSKKVETSIGMSMAVIFVMTMASAITWAFMTFLLAPMGLEYLRTATFILVIASLVQFVEIVLQKVSPVLYQALGIFLPLITTNCAVLGAAILNIQEGYTFIESLVHGIAAGLGFAIAIILFAAIRERLELADVPKAMAGLPIAYVVTGLMAIAFFGFQGLFRTVFVG